jgi:hypothetical protein
VGEKYDDCYEYDREPLLRIDPSYRPLQLTAIPRETLERMRRDTPEARAEITGWLDRPAQTMDDAFAHATSTLQQAGSDPASLASASRDAVRQLIEAHQVTEQQFGESGALLRELDRNSTFSKSGLKDLAMASGRKVHESAAKASGFTAFVHTLLGTAQDSALNAYGAQIEAVVNRTVEVAATNVSRVSRGVLQRGMADVPDEGPAAA